MPRTWKQNLRQKTRDGSGKYKTMFKCEVCGKATGVDYFSLLDCNEKGLGVCVCDKCATAYNRKFEEPKLDPAIFKLAERPFGG
jgi:transcription elongation factor Elf1